MTLKVTILPADPEFSGRYPTYLVPNADCIEVGVAGDLKLTAYKTVGGKVKELRIYAPGFWKEINVCPAEE